MVVVWAQPGVLAVLWCLRAEKLSTHISSYQHFCSVPVPRITCGVMLAVGRVPGAGLSSMSEVAQSGKLLCVTMLQPRGEKKPLP